MRIRALLKQSQFSLPERVFVLPGSQGQPPAQSPGKTAD